MWKKLDLLIFSKCISKFSKFILKTSTSRTKFSIFLLNYMMHDFWWNCGPMATFFNLWVVALILHGIAQPLWQRCPTLRPLLEMPERTLNFVMMPLIWCRLFWWMDADFVMMPTFWNARCWKDADFLIVKWWPVSGLISEMQSFSWIIHFWGNATVILQL